MKLDGTAELKQQQVNASSCSLFQEKDEKMRQKHTLDRYFKKTNANSYTKTQYTTVAEC